MEKKNFFGKIKEKILNILPNISSLLTNEEQRTHIQFLCLFIVLAVISCVMTIMNIYTGYTFLMWQTRIFMICNIINAIVEYKGNEKIRKYIHSLFAFEFIFLLTSFVYVGQPMGFSAIWAALLPACGLMLYKLKLGTIVALIQFAILAFSFWTPIGRSLLPDVYTEAFIMRFPVLYGAFFVVGVFLEIVRYYTQAELEKARDYYKEKYTDEEIKAEKERKFNYDIISTLASSYSSVYYVDLLSGAINKYSRSSQSDNFDPSLTYDEMVIKYANDIVYEEDKTLFIENCNSENVKNKLANQKSFFLDYRINTDSEPRYYEITIVKVGDENHAPDDIVVALSDVDAIIREEKNKQEALQKAMHEAQIASEAKTKFLFNMSHDIRTPMNAIMGFTEMAQNHIDEKEKVKDCLSKVSISGEHLLKLINDVLDMSRIDNGKVEIEPVSANLHDCADKMMAIVEQSAKDKNISLHLDYYDIVADNLYIDTLRLNQILINIINNSIKYTPDGGHIICKIIQHNISDDGMVPTDFIIEDDGIGMSEEFVQQIFESFSRARNSTVSGIQGTGLGMTITKRLVDLMKGDIRVESKENVGTKVIVKLNFKQSFEQTVAKTEETKPIIAVKNENVRILLVDDNAFNLEIASELLTDEGYEVIEANDGTVAVDILKKHEPDYFSLILMDVQMPIMNGYEATKEIRSWGGHFAKLPIIALTANAFEEDKRTALEMGMNGHLAKPIDTTKLFELINNIENP